MSGAVSAFAIGPGCVAWFVVAEIFPAYATDAAMALGVALNWLGNSLIAFAFPLVNAALGPYTFLLFAASTFGFGLFTLWGVPETTRKTTSELTPSSKTHQPRAWPVYRGCASGLPVPWMSSSAS